MKIILLLFFAFSATQMAIAESGLTRKIQIAPAQIPKDSPKLKSLLKTSKGETITTTEQWFKQREVLKRDWEKFMGEFPKQRAPLKTEFLAKEDLPEFTRQYVKYQIEEGVFEDGYLLTPKNLKGKLPAIVVFHPTTPFQARGVAGLEPTYDAEKRQGVHLVQRGYVVWCPRNFIFDEGTKAKPNADMWTANAKRIYEQHPNWSAMARMTFDAIRAADFVESLPNVDKSRIGCIGHSLGGKMALYAPAFDERYKASVSSEAGIGLKFSNWDAAWYLGSKIKDPKFILENDQVLSMVAPRAFLLLAGDSADSDKSWSFFEAAMPVYKLFGATENLGWFNHHQGHRYSPEAREMAESFLDAHLKK
ncbi:MAG: dienelactone hydrolase family protein [Verrucomicrobiota bacterium]